MKQFELHPASESYYRKEGAVNCSRRLSAAILSLVATVVCTFLVLAVSSTTAYATVGDTFIKEGLTYKVVNDSYEVEIIDCDESASSVNVRTSIMYGEGALQDSYSVVGVSEDAFSDYEGTVVLEQNASSFYENIFNSLPEGAIVPSCQWKVTPRSSFYRWHLMYWKQTAQLKQSICRMDGPFLKYGLNRQMV